MASLCGKMTQKMGDISSELELGGAHKFSYRSLQAATNNFSKHNLIDVGSFAKTYRGVLPNGALIAVRKYRPESIKDLIFRTNVEILSCTQHPNINRVTGCCVNKSNLLLVHEYMSNGSLHDLVRDKEKRETMFSWPKRVAVCSGIARGLYHLHEEINPCVIHRDIKSSNALLDSNFTPQITGFDLAKFVYESPLEEEEYDRVIGTYGYLDPEFYATSKCTPKSDVYGFGVVMLEIICGRTAISYGVGDEASVYLVQWALDLLAKDRVLEVVDPVLADFSVDQMMSFMDVAFSCLEKESRLRPSMEEVVQMLNRVCDSPLMLFELQQPNTPYFSAASSFRSSMAQTYDDFEGESSILDGESSMELKETTNLQAQVKQAIETSATYSNTINIAQQQNTGITVSSSGNLVERQSQTTMVIERPIAGRGEYAAYWRKKNMMPRFKS